MTLMVCMPNFLAFIALSVNTEIWELKSGWNNAQIRKNLFNDKDSRKKA